MSRSPVLTAMPLATALAWVPATAQPEPPVEVQVQRGDTLIGLLREGADWSGVARSNRIADPKRLLPGSVLRIPPALLREQPVVAEVVHAYGQVTVTRGAQAPQPLAAGDSVAAGDVVRTGAQSSATLRFADGARVLVRPDSELRVERLAQSRGGASTTLRLHSGSADSTVPPHPASAPRYEMRTPQAHLGVRGTEFRAAADAGTTRLEVLEGRVGARGPDAAAARARSAEALVAAGFGAVSAAGPAGGLAAARPLPEAPALTGLAARIERMPLRLAWQAQAGSRVRAQVFSTEAVPRLLLDGVFDAAPARWNEDIPDGRYELRVRAIAADGLEGRDARAPFELAARPEPPFVAAPPADSRHIDETIRLAWTRNAAAARVRLQVADGVDFAAPRIDRSDLDAAELRVALPLGTHHWRVASIHADGRQGPFSDAQRLTRTLPPPAPPPAEPQADAAGLRLRWPAAAGASGQRWQVQVARDAAFADLLLDETVAEPQLLLRDPAAGDYFLRVRTIDADGFVGPYGQSQRIEVPRSRWWWLLLPLVLLAL